MILFLSLQREVTLLVQLDGLCCRLFTGERQNYNPSDPRGCGMPLKTCRENRFLWPQSSDLYFTVWGELTCRATSGAGCVCTNFPPPPPAPSWLPQLERWELNSPVVKQQQTSLPDGMVERGKDRGRRRGAGGVRGGMDLQERQMQRGQNVFFDRMPAQTGQKDFFLEWHDSQ